MTKRFAKAAILHPEAQEVEKYYTMGRYWLLVHDPVGIIDIHVEEVFLKNSMKINISLLVTREY